MNQELRCEDLVPLYLLEHPEEESYFHWGQPEGLDEPTGLIEQDAVIRFSAWGVKAGYFQHENHVKLVKMVERMKERHAQEEE
ncbi:MAG TPA: hypothetical protein VFC02_14660 [Anaerolineales bacterium]|jgi:hypothetical protein|nr:hypothetical protein [Anaerolineales bacterium]